MKAILNLMRLMVGISMPTAGFFLFMIAEGSHQMLMSAFHEGALLRKEAEKDPTPINEARYEGARLVYKSFGDASGWFMVASWTGLITSSLLCIFAMRAGRRIKRLIDQSAPPAESKAT